MQLNYALVKFKIPENHGIVRTYYKYAGVRLLGPERRNSNVMQVIFCRRTMLSSKRLKFICLK